MAKIDRYDGNLRAFGSSATGTERTVFGDTSQSDTLDDNVVADFFRGWGITGPTFNPTKQDFNGLGFTLGQLIAYLHQQGIPEWNTSQEYYRGSVVTTLAGIYRLKNGGDATVDPDNDNGTNWELAPTRAEVDAKADKATTYTETEVDGLLDDKAAISGQAFSGNISAPNLIGTNTGDQDLSGKADKATTYTETEVDGLIATRTESPDETAITGTATFTNSDNNIALTGIGSIGLEIGDVVQVTGTANNDKLFTVEVITDDDNVVVNQAHAGGTTSKSLVNETVSATVTLVAKWYNAADSLGRGWVDVTIDRSQNVAYSTLINRGFIVIVSTEERRGTANFKVNGENVAYDNPESNVASSATIDVTAASTYEYTGTITLWSELR